MKNFTEGNFPERRLRRNRQRAWTREILAETTLEARNLIMPFFVTEGKNIKEPIASLPDNYRFSIDLLIIEVHKAQELGIQAVMLFPNIHQKHKDLLGTEAYRGGNLICKAIKALKKVVPEMGVICDVALDPYTTHGHDGVLNKKGDDVDNDATIAALCKQALVFARAGCDAVSPSDMMDGRVGKIRQYLDRAGLQNVLIISYAAKYASNFYGPFRDAVGSKNNRSNFNKKTYQMDFRNSKEALREIAADIAEGADIVIIKPGLPYLDIIFSTSQHFSVPIISYQVSGEYTMLRLAAEYEVLNFEAAMMESLIALKRAGSSAIITYAAMKMAAWLNDRK